MSYKNSHPKTYQYMQTALNIGAVKNIDNFTLSARQEILSILFDELSSSDQMDLLNDVPIEPFIGKKMIVFGYGSLSDFELYEIRLNHVTRYWCAVDNLLENIFDEAETDFWREHGGISDVEDHRREWISEKDKEARDLNNQWRRAV